ncbi:MAG: cyclic nucleotide-binding domain-containing protein [Alphaproteobacteria bacterium]|nr:cyclic nucleotide-binding domain-containing protein [Alphaproteobacteria bacterium]
MRPDDRKDLRATPLFAALSDEHFARVCDGAVVHAMPRGALLCRQGEQPEFLHVILSGRVALIAANARNEETVVEFFDSGDSFIAAAVILDAPYLMSARVVHDARVALLSAERFRADLTAVPALGLSLAMQFAGYWRRLIRQIKDLKLRSGAERLAVYLIALSGRDSGAATLALPQERKLIAAHIGITPESLSRAFITLRPLGVSGRGRTVTIADIARLRAFCGADDPT